MKLRGKKFPSNEEVIGKTNAYFTEFYIFCERIKKLEKRIKANNLKSAIEIFIQIYM